MFDQGIRRRPPGRKFQAESVFQVSGQIVPGPSPGGQNQEKHMFRKCYLSLVIFGGGGRILPLPRMPPDLLYQVFAETIPNKYQDHPKIIPSTCQNHANIIPRSS